MTRTRFFYLFCYWLICFGFCAPKVYGGSVVGPGAQTTPPVLNKSPPQGLAQSLPQSLNAQESHPEMSLEALYLEAVLSYNSRKNIEALQILNTILQAKPSYIQALELEALVLKDQGEKTRSRQVYQGLLDMKPKNETGPYHYELGILFQSEKKYPEAKAEFREALTLGFNTEASHFYLGWIGFIEGQLSEAEEHFRKAIESPNEWRMVSYYYLAMIDANLKYRPASVREMFEAIRIAESLPKNALSDQIIKGATSMLAPYEVGQWFGSISILGQYDGNVSLLPNSATTPDQISGKSTAKTVFVVGFGHASPAVDSVQWLANYRTIFNYNFNPASITSEFFTHSLDLFLTYHALAETSYGVRLQGIYNFQETGSALQAYSFTGELGPFIKKFIGKQTSVTGELVYRPQMYWAVTDLNTSLDLMARMGIRQDTQEGIWNPSLNVSLERNITQGSAYRYLAFSVGGSDGVHISDGQMLSPSVLYTNYVYTDAVPQRLDANFLFKLSWLDSVSEHWSVSTDISYQMNFSTYDSYTYTQPVVSLGISYML